MYGWPCACPVWATTRVARTPRNPEDPHFFALSPCCFIAALGLSETTPTPTPPPNRAGRFLPFPLGTMGDGSSAQTYQPVAANKMSLYDRSKYKFIHQPTRLFYDRVW